MRKICAITANRADFSRIETVLRAIQKHADLELQLIVMGSHLLNQKGKTIDEIRKNGFRVDHTINIEMAGDNLSTMTKSVGLAIIELATILENLKPDVVIAPVDRFESLAIGIAPALMNIHVAHIQGGEVTGTIDESIRHALTKMSHLHFVASQKSGERVIKMGESPEFVFNVGCPATDLLLSALVLSRAETLAGLNALALVESRLNENEPYILMVQHPVTTEFGGASSQIIETLEALRGIEMQVIVLLPNIDAGSDEIANMIKKYSSEEGYENIYCFSNIPSTLFANILRNAPCVIGNSSSGIREACYFGTPVVNIGSRQNRRERSHNVLDVGYDREEIAEAIKKQLAHGQYPVDYIYGDGTAGEKIAEILAVIKMPDIQKRITY